MPTAPNFTNLRSWLGNLDKSAAALPEKKDDGKPATTGAHAADNKSDYGTIPGADVNSKNPVDGHAETPVPDSGLEQGTSGKMPVPEAKKKDGEPSVEEAAKEAAKAASADLDTPEGMALAVAALEKAAAAMPTLFAAAGVRINQPGAKAAAEIKDKAPGRVQPELTAKQAADLAVSNVVAGYQKWGSDRGALTGRYLLGFQQTYDALVKMANDGQMDAQMAADAAPGGEMPGGPPAPGGEAPPMAPPGGDLGADGPPPGAGGEAGPGGGEGGAPSLEDIAAALGEMGLTPDDLMQIAQQMQGGVQGDQGAPPAEKEAALKVLKSLEKSAADAKALMRSGKFSLKPAADGTGERKRRNAAKGYISELLAASK